MGRRRVVRADPGGRGAAAELNVSPHHTAGWGLVKEDAGLALRFPRFSGRWRDDKAPTDATTVEEAVAMYRTARRLPADA